MKTVFTNKELAHVWANQTEAELRAGRFGRGSGCSFDGPAFRSYATVIARIVSHRGKRAFLRNTTSYSNSTSKHQSHVWNAIPDVGVESFSLEGGARRTEFTPTAKEIFEAYQQKARTALERGLRARRSSVHYLAQAEDAIRGANRVREFFGLRNKPFALDLSALATHAKSEEAKQEIRELQARQRREALEKGRAQAEAEFSPRMLALWRVHGEYSTEAQEIKDMAAAKGVYRFAYAAHLAQNGFAGTSALRLSSDRDRVETSQGAQVLARTVKFLWAFCSEAKRTQTPVAAETLARFPRLDYYYAREIDASGNLTAGCHRIPFGEVEYIARELGLPPFNGAPAESPTIPDAQEVAS